MRIEEYSYRGATGIIPLNMQEQVRDTLRHIAAPIQHRGAPKIRQEVTACLRSLGWSNQVRLDSTSHITISAVKDHVGICVQLGNVSRIYADLLKLQTLFIRDSIGAGVIILPTPQAARTLGQNIANSARLQRELTIFNAVVTLPLWLVSFDD